MANIKISELNTATQLEDVDVIPVVQDGETKKVTVETVGEKVEDLIGVATTSQNGLMSSTDKSKVNSLGNVANLTYEVISTF